MEEAQVSRANSQQKWKYSGLSLHKQSVDKTTVISFASLFPHLSPVLPFLSLLSPLSQAKCTLPELRKLYFELKDEIFSTASHSGYNCDTGKLEQLLKKYLGDTMKLSDVDHPKYVDRC